MKPILLIIIFLNTFGASFSQSANAAISKIRTADLKSAVYRDSVKTMREYWPNEEWVREENIREFHVKYAFGDLTGDRFEEASVSVSTISVAVVDSPGCLSIGMKMAARN